MHTPRFPFSSLLLVTCVCLTPACHQEQSATDHEAAFVAAGFHKESLGWVRCEEPGTPGYRAGTIDRYGDINGDGRPDAVISEGSTYCYGFTGIGYAIVSRQANGEWKLMDRGEGLVSFLETKGADGWPDIEIGGPGFCFPVKRWDGHRFAPNGYQYEHQPCQPTQPSRSQE